MGNPSFDACAASVAATIRNYGEDDARRLALTFARNLDYDADKLFERAKEILREQRYAKTPAS